MIITFEILNNCMNVANENLKSGTWTENNVTIYCGTLDAHVVHVHVVMDLMIFEG